MRDCFCVDHNRVGLVSKYVVMKRGPEGLVQKRSDSFVLSPTKDDQYGSASRTALLTYAKRIKRTNAALAADLVRWVRRIQRDIQTEHRARRAGKEVK